jgi:hypothetical protein
MKLDDLTQEIETFLKDPVIISESDVNSLSYGLWIMKSDFKKLLQEEEVKHNEDRFVKVLNCLLTVSAYVLDAPMHNRFVTFAMAYSEMIFNWNANMQKDEVLRQLCLYVSRTCEVRNDIVTTVNVLKDVDDRLRELSSWTPPSYEIATEYFEKLLEENETRKEY